MVSRRTRSSGLLGLGEDGGEPLDLPKLLESLSEDQRTMVKIINILSKEDLHDQISDLKESLKAKDEQIQGLRNEVHELRQELMSVKQDFDKLEQYGRRENIILSGPKLPLETSDGSGNENTTEKFINIVKNELKIELKKDDISISHRLGSKRDDNDSKPRPIIVKLVNRSLKYDLINECIQRRPQLYINESLTPMRLKLYRQLLAVRYHHKPMFKQLYTSEGVIMVKMEASSGLKHRITDEASLSKFLDTNPTLKETHKRIMAEGARPTS